MSLRLFCYGLLILSAALSARAESSDPELQKLIQHGNQELGQGVARSALFDFEKAEKRSNNTSAQAFWGEARAHYQLGEYKEAAAACQKVIALEKDPPSLALVHNYAGMALVQASNKKNDKLLKEAEQEFRAALTNSNGSSVHMNLGLVLIYQGRVDEGIAELKQAQAIASPPSTRLQRLIDHPELAKLDLAPEFSAKTLDGESIDIDGLQGKVVLLDFWASWCYPCRTTLPKLKKEYAKLSSEPVVFLSISADESEEKLRDFLASDKPLWAQVYDANDNIRTMYAVRAFPTFFVIGPDGVIRYRSTGSDDVPIGEVKKQLKQLGAPGGTQAKAIDTAK
jgi:thiol-disulfide isomerase/thioredoxin